MSFLRRLFGKSGYDEMACIRMLFDRTLPLSERGAAAESLYTGQTSTAIEALLSFVRDDTQEMVIREEAATTLGDIYNLIGVDRQALDTVPSDILQAILGGISADNRGNYTPSASYNKHPVEKAEQGRDGDAEEASDQF